VKVLSSPCVCVIAVLAGGCSFDASQLRALADGSVEPLAVRDAGAAGSGGNTTGAPDAPAVTGGNGGSAATGGVAGAGGTNGAGGIGGAGGTTTSPTGGTVGSSGGSTGAADAGTPLGVLSIDKVTLTFGSVDVGATSATQIVTVTNSGSKPVAIVPSITGSGAFSIAQTCGFRPGGRQLCHLGRLHSDGDRAGERSLVDFQHTGGQPERQWRGPGQFQHGRCQPGRQGGDEHLRLWGGHRHGPRFLSPTSSAR